MAGRSRISQLPGEFGVQGHVIDVSATNDEEHAIWVNNTGATVKIKEAGFIPDAAVTGAATNNMALQLVNNGTDGTGTDGITAVKTYASGVDIAKFDQDNFVLSTTAADLLVDDGEVVSLEKTENGTGAIQPAGLAVLTYEFV